MNEQGNARKQVVSTRIPTQATQAESTDHRFRFVASWMLTAFVGFSLFTPFAAANRWSESAGVHPNHFSTAEVGWNEKTGKFEVALRVWPSDLEKVLTEIAGKSIDLAKSEDLDQMMAHYIADKFTILKVAKAATTDQKGESTLPEQPLNSSSAPEATKAQAATAIVNDPNSAMEKSQPGETKDATSTESQNSTPVRETDSDGHFIKREELGQLNLADKLPEGFRWVGFESNVKDAWLYFELPGDLEPATYEIENRVFFEFNEEQINQIRFTCAGQTRSFSLKRNLPTWQFSTERAKLRKRNSDKAQNDGR